GIRDDLVTGVQTCALPISGAGRQSALPGPAIVLNLLHVRSVSDAVHPVLIQAIKSALILACESSAGKENLVNPKHRELILLRCPDRKSTRLNSSHQIISYA